MSELPGDQRDGGRVFVFPGRRRLTGLLSAREVIDLTAIEAVVGLGGVPASKDQVVDRQGFVRPVVGGGRLTLRVRPAGQDRLVPFEQPYATPCCADHL